jgi:hypothetical protein
MEWRTGDLTEGILLPQHLSGGTEKNSNTSVRITHIRSEI